MRNYEIKMSFIISEGPKAWAKKTIIYFVIFNLIFVGKMPYIIF